MRCLAVLAVGACLIAVSSPAAAGPFPPVGLSGADVAPIELVATKSEKKSDTVTQKVKRAWRNLTGYKFDVSCPAFPTPRKSTCTETGKSQGEAQAKCQSRNGFCWVTAAK